MKLSIEQKIGLFRMLASKPLYEVGLEYGFDKHYKDSKAVKGAVYRIYADMKNNPEKYHIEQDMLTLVVDAVSARKVAHRKQDISLKEKTDVPMEIKDVILSNRDKAAALVSKKLDMIGKSRKQLESISLPQLTTAMAILFDKGQLIQGEATEHIAHLAKIDEGMTPQELLDAVVGQREKTIIDKNK